jgi:hypothetical protein
MDYVHGEIGWGDMSGDLAKVVCLDNGQPLLLAVTAKEHRRDLAIWRI